MATKANYLTDRRVHLVAQSLRDFGYPSVTDEQVRDLSDKLLDGRIVCAQEGELPEGGVITMFIHSQLVEAGVLKE